MTLPALMGSLLLTATLTTLAQQEPVWQVRDTDGAVVCRIVAPTKSADAGRDRLAIDIRVPGTPSPSLTSRLPARSRDYSNLPIRVYLVPAPAKGQTASSTLPEVTPLDVDFVERRLGVHPDAILDTFIRVEYSRRSLIAGVDLVAERTAIADSGARITSQSRCRISTAEAQRWR